MLLISDFLFQQFSSYDPIYLYLELIAVFFGLLSVWFAKNNNIAVYPTGIISTLIFVYLLYQQNLMGDMLINGYYFIMSIYGWYIWSRNKKGESIYKISYLNSSDKIKSIILFVISIVFVLTIYFTVEIKLTIIPIIDTLTTGIFFVGMWMMAKRKIENWIMWIIGDLISIPLYFYKGMFFTSLQYLIFTIIAIYGILSWKKIYNSRMERNLK